MINCKKFYELLIRNSIDFFTGVPDSLLKDFCAYVTDNTPQNRNIIAANEGNAIALAAGYHLATGKIALVYMQNSGLGNAINPLTSLADEGVYSIPMLLLVGWRGEPGVQDEPQHAKMGRITLEMLENIGVPCKVLDDNFEDIIEDAKRHMEIRKSPYAIVVRKGAFDKCDLQNKKQNDYEMMREEAIRIMLSLMDKDDVIVSTTGKTSRELFELREISSQGHEKDFLTVGCMGHSSSIALGIALAKPKRQVYCFDGDGALIMHMGALSVIGQLKPDNLKQVVFNNFAHDSVGGQPTAASNIDIPSIAKANGYADAFTVATATELQSKFNIMKKLKGPVLLEIRINKGSRENLGRPTIKPTDNKEDFIKFVRK